MALQAAAGRLGTTQRTHVYTWGHFSPPAGLSSASQELLLPPTWVTPPPVNSTLGWTLGHSTELSGTWLQGQGANPAPSPSAAPPAARALPPASSLFRAMNGKDHTSASEGGGPAHSLSGEASWREDDLLEAPLPRVFPSLLPPQPV